MLDRIKRRLKDESYALRSKDIWRDEWVSSPYFSQKTLIFYRGSSCLFWLVWTLYDLTRDARFKIGGTHWTFFTNWVIFLTGVYFICVCMTVFYLKLHTEDRRLPCIGKLAWVLLNMLTSTSLAITLGFWTLYYDEEKPVELSFKVFFDHGLGTCCILADIMLTYTPLYFKHAYQGMLFSLVYFLFSIIYDYSLSKSEMKIYKFLDWSSHFGSTLAATLAFVLILVPLFHFLLALFKPQLESNEIENEDNFL